MSYHRHKQTPLTFYLSEPTPCVYLPGEIEQKVFLPCQPQSDGGHYLKVEDVHAKLIQYGFRRSHEVVYRPQCPNCTACESIRIPISDFQLGRRMKRIKKMNQDLICELGPARATLEQFELFKSYLEVRHRDGEMVHMEYESYRQMVEIGNSKSGQIMLRTPSGSLLGVMLYDEVEDGLSATYSFFDPSSAWRSLGVYLVLSLIDYGAAFNNSNYKYIYLGYYIAKCSKMAYKIEYQPSEVFRDGVWQRIEKPA